MSDGWITGPALEVVVQLKALLPGDEVEVCQRLSGEIDEDALGVQFRITDLTVHDDGRLVATGVVTKTGKGIWRKRKAAISHEIAVDTISAWRRPLTEEKP